MRLPHLARVMGGAAAAWNFRWGPFGIQTEHEVRTLPPVSFRWHTHEAITQAALEILPASDLAVLGPEAELLASVFCGFPDQNWMTYGGFLAQFEERLPDCRRFWDISGYCRHHPLTGAGGFIGHGPPTAVEAVRKLTAQALEAFRGGRQRDGVRHLGAALHYLQDSGTPGHVITTSSAIHHALDTLPDELVGIPGYEPAVLAEVEAEVVTAVAARTEKLTADIVPVAEEMLELIAREGMAAARDLQAQAANECARATADVLHTVCRVVSSVPQRPTAPAPVGVELLPNGSFELDYDWDGVPDGWLVRWHDLDDRTAIAERTSRHSHAGYWSVRLGRTPAAGLEWLTCWPAAVDVEGGQSFVLSAYVRADAATGATYLAAYCYDDRAKEVGRSAGASVVGSCEWTRIEHRFTVPAAATRLLVGLRSDANAGDVWFDDVSLVRVNF